MAADVVIFDPATVKCGHEAVVRDFPKTTWRIREPAEGINIDVSAADCEQLAAVVADRNSLQKHVCRSRVILATAEGCGAAEIMRPGRGLETLRVVPAGAVHG